MRVLTIDLEDWFQVYNFRKVISFEEWGKQEYRVVQNTQKILEILNEHNTRATFFVLGWIAEKFPELIKDVHRQGHEIACHGYNHRPVFELTKEEFEEDIDKAVNAIKKAAGVSPGGYRGPSFSIIKSTLWALDVLRKKGFEYDCSMMPVKHPDYGIKGIPQHPFKMKGMLEIPLTTTYGLPIGGGYFRTYPYWFTKQLVKRNKNAVFYIHPWEFDQNIPRFKLPLTKRFRHYVGLKKTEMKFRKLLRDFRFVPVSEFIKYSKINRQ